MNFPFLAIVTILGMVGGTLAMLEAGRRLGVRRMARDPEGARAGTGAIDGAVFGLMGLLIAFTFSGAGARFDTRRAMIVEEANSIGTAWLRLDLLPAAAQPPLRGLFRQYFDARLAAFRKVPNITAMREELARAAVLQNHIWAQAVAACRDDGSQPTTMLLFPHLTKLFDFAPRRLIGFETPPPMIIYAMLGMLL